MKAFTTAQVLFIMPLRSDRNVREKRGVIVDILGTSAILPDMAVGNPNNEFDIIQACNVLKSVELVIADLSFERPSCYFELGMAQALSIPCLLIAEQGTQIHQHSGNVEFYVGIEEFRQIIHRVAKGKTKQHSKALNRSRDSGEN